MKISIEGENSQDESISVSHGDSGMVVNTGKIALSDGRSVGTDYACGNPKENKKPGLHKVPEIQETRYLHFICSMYTPIYASIFLKN